MSRLLPTALVFALAASACTRIEQPQPVDDQGEPIEVPEPYDRWLQIESVAPSPGEVSLRPSIAVSFSDYIDDDSFRSYAFASASSGGLTAFGGARYIMTDKTVVWQPWNALEPGLRYRFAPTGDVVSATGSPLILPPKLPVFVPRSDVAPTPATELPDARWQDVAPIFEARCAGCHDDPDAQLPALTYDGLVGVQSSQTDLALVRPADPADSYLMRKLLWDYADIEFTHQPPPWSAGSEELPRGDLLTIEGWIAHGARR